MASKPSIPLRVDYRKGSRNLALYQPLRDLLSPCRHCAAPIGPSWKLNPHTSIYNNRDSKGKEIPPTCTRCYDTGKSLTTLSSGDVSFIGNNSEGEIKIGVEVKDLSDLLTSISNGRLQDTQIINGMVNDYHIDGRWLLHYGMYRPDSNGYIEEYKESRYGRPEGWYPLSLGDRPVRYSYLESFKVSPQLLDLGFRVVRVNNIIEAAWWLTTLYKSWTKPYHTHKSMQTLDRSQDVESLYLAEIERSSTQRHSKSGQFTRGSVVSSINNRVDPKFMARLRTAFTFPSLGYERAKAVAGSPRFSTIMEMMRAAEEGDLADIDGIGDKISKRIKEYLS